MKNVQNTENEDLNVDEKVNHTETFAANIASLYYDSFFMQQGSIGDIAKGSISNLFLAISSVKELKLSNEQEIKNKLVEEYTRIQFSNQENFKITFEQIQAFINCIGEDIWRYKLREDLNSLFSNCQDNPKKIFNYIKNSLNDAEINELKKYLENYNGKT